MGSPPLLKRMTCASRVHDNEHERAYVHGFAIPADNGFAIPAKLMQVQSKNTTRHHHTNTIAIVAQLMILVDFRSPHKLGRLNS
jgi:hypothetical protein